jgi:negative regulator of sigma E activity
MLLSLKGLRLVLPWCLVAGLLPGLAGAGPDAASAAGPADARGWLARIHAAANTRNYQGTMVFAPAA